MNVVVEKLTGRDVAGLYEASILLKHEARQAVGAPPFEDGFKCPSCGHQIVRNSDEKRPRWRSRRNHAVGPEEITAAAAPEPATAPEPAVG